MNVVDSSAWLEYFADGPNAGHFATAIEDTEELLVPAITLLEVFKRVSQQRSETVALTCIAAMRAGQVVDLDATLAVQAARFGLQYKLPLADSIVYATARAGDAVAGGLRLARPLARLRPRRPMAVGRGPARAVRAGAVRGGFGAGDAQLLAGYPHLLEVLEDLRRHAVREVDQAVVVMDVHAADVLAVQARLVGDGADDVAGLHAMRVADLDAEGLEAGLCVARRAFACGTDFPLVLRRGAGRAGFMCGGGLLAGVGFAVPMRDHRSL